MVALTSGCQYRCSVASPWTTQDPEEAAAQVVAELPAAWLDKFQDALDRRRSSKGLGYVLAVWSLNQSDAAALFGVSRQAVSKWLESGVPAERAQAVADLEAATDLLVRYLRRDRIAAVVRRPFNDAGGRSILDLAAKSPAQALAAVRAMFDFAAVHA